MQTIASGDDIPQRWKYLLPGSLEKTSAGTSSRASEGRH